MDLFLHPWYMAAGAALMSLPLIIHLINRMRYKRVRWAAMEFLLKSQKRNRRKMIIEQLLLLLMRMFLVLLLGFLVARYVGGALGNTASGTHHVVILDDTPSMGDRWGEKDAPRTALSVGKEQILGVAKMASEANSAQQMTVFLLSDLKTPLFDGRLDSGTDQKLKSLLDTVSPSALHLDPLVGLEAARDVLIGRPEGKKIIHFVSDFRDGDWSSGGQSRELTEKIDAILNQKININLMDTAHPFRSEMRGEALSHNNLAILDFQAESRIAAEGVPVEFTVAIHNYGTKQESSFLNVQVNGAPDYIASQPLESLPPGQTTVKSFTLLFQKSKPTPEFKQISASIRREESGLQVDNNRDLVIEVRQRIPALIVDGAGPVAGSQPGGDAFHIDEALKASRAYKAEIRTLDSLERTNLDEYPCIYLLNIPEIKNEKILAKLKEYVKNGGSLAYFLGGKTGLNTTFYNEVLHTQYDGLFPVKIALQPTADITPEEKEAAKLKDRQSKDPAPKILFRDKNHPIVKEGLAPIESAFAYLMIARYYPTLSRQTWVADEKADKNEKVVEVITLPNRKPVETYRTQVQDLRKKAEEDTRDLAAGDKKFEVYLPVLEQARRDIITALTSQNPVGVQRAIDRILNDSGDPKNPARPNMTELWQHPRMTALKKQLEDFLESIKYGDPLVVTRQYGKGKILACLTPAGTLSGWNEWGAGSSVSWTYPIFLRDLQRYLVSEGSNRVVTADANIRLEFDADAFEDKVEGTFQAQPDLDTRKGDENPELKKLPELRLEPDPKDTRLKVFNFREARNPGVYTFEFTPLDKSKPTEVRSYAFNIDTRESDLKRTPSEKLTPKREVPKEARTGELTLSSPGEPLSRFKDRQPDASESPWLYLLFILILVAEQALAVHLSYHLKPGDQSLAPAPRLQPSAA